MIRYINTLSDIRQRMCDMYDMWPIINEMKKSAWRDANTARWL